MDFSQLKSLVNLENVSLNVTTKTDSLVKFDKSTNNYNITVNVQSNEVSNPEVLNQAIRQMVKDQVENQEKPVLEQSVSRTLDDISSNDKYAEQVVFFSGKIPENDLVILKAAYYLRTVHERGESITLLRQGIIQRYGSRGSNISNLCSAGYFESYIRPLYETLAKRENFEKEMFLGNYELIITNAPFAYFVNNNQGLADLIAKITQKLEFNKRYGLHQLTIHAIGRENISKVYEMLEDSTIKGLLKEEPDVNIKSNVMSVTIQH